jgi:cytochrome c-type biogenesis protein CcmH/NrfG
VDYEYALLVAIVLVVAMHTVGLYLRRRPRIDSNSSEYFRDQCQRMLEMNKLDELVAYARKRILQRPKQTNAHWYLARALYLQGKWADALASFNEVARLDPSWLEKSVTPHIRAIEAKLQPKDVPVVSEAPDQPPRTLH